MYYTNKTAWAVGLEFLWKLKSYINHSYVFLESIPAAPNFGACLSHDNIDFAFLLSTIVHMSPSHIIVQRRNYL